MTTENTPAPRKRTLLIVAIVAVVVAVAAIGLSIYLVARGGGDAAPTPTPTNDVQTPAATGTGVDACLGGAELSASVVFTAQQEAAHSPEGAVSYAASFARYMLQVPLPEDIDEAASWTALTAADWQEWKAGIEGWTGPTPLSATTVNGSYRVQSYTPDEAVIGLRLPWVIDGAISPERAFAPTVTLQWTVGGSWSVSGLNGSAADNSAALADDSDFTGGC